MNIAIVTGGFSEEAKISEKSAQTVWKNLPAHYEKHLIRIDQTGWWYITENNAQIPVDKNDFSVTVNNSCLTFDVVFLIIHGTPGEDGKLQGYFDLLKIPYTTSGVLASAITFNKGITTALLRNYGIKSAQSVVISKKDRFSAKEILQKTGLPCFIKPNKGGSSIGVSKVEKESDLVTSINKAFEHDDEIIIEEFIEGREVTCGVINYKGTVKALAVTEIISPNNFFDFNAKYQNKNTKEITPAPIEKTLYEQCMNLTEKIYKTLQLKGMARIDYIIRNNQLYLIEVNTIPGLTEQSLLPQQAAHQNISLPELLENSIQQALGKF